MAITNVVDNGEDSEPLGIKAYDYQAVSRRPGGRTSRVQPRTQMVVSIVWYVTSGLTAAGVSFGSGSGLCAYT
jgi:hypothetical protein